ncbi:MAG: hypothetical protein JWP29_590 [Rhodoferax sp.]|nr:hypothetical protein [Rhodoferax sp.]
MPAPREDAPAPAAPDWVVIHIHPSAPPKPEFGAPCNGCGVCCLAEPCPVGVLYSRRRHGACDALRWDEPLGLYRCGLAAEPLTLIGWPGAPRWLQRWARRLVQRWIAAGDGCDAAMSVESPKR